MLRHVYKAAFVLALCFLAFLWGFITPVNKTFPYDIMANAFRGLDAWVELSIDALYPRIRDQWIEARPSKEGLGVVRYDPERAYNGHTLFTSSGTEAAFLIDMQGKIVHEWDLPYHKVWNRWKRQAAVKHPVAAGRIHLRRVYLYPDGDLLAIYVAAGVTPWGYGLVKMDRNSRPIWAYLHHVHHDLAVGPDGRIYTLTQKIQRTPFSDLPKVPVPAIEDFVVVLSPDGKPLKRISIYEAFARSRYRSVMDLITKWNLGDQIHTNAIKPVTAAIARRFSFTRVGEVLLSFRNLSGLALLDLKTEKIVWFLGGPWRHQHDPEFLPDGHMMLFDNDGDLARGGRSRVLEFDPNNLEIFWQYPGWDGDDDFNSGWQGTVQELPNRNVLITEADNARLLEVTRDKKIVWEYRNPLRAGPNKGLTGVLSSGHRFGPHDLHFQFNYGHVPAFVNTAQEEQHAKHGS